MGIGGISVWQLLIILVIVMLLFGTKRISQFGWDFGEMIKGMREGMKAALPEAAKTARELNDFKEEVVSDVKEAGKVAAGIVDPEVKDD